MAATSRPAAPKAQFRLLGFPVHVRSGFIIFMILLAVVPRGDNGEFGIWLAGSVAVFTLLHELGHAVVARRAGAEAEISLDFLAGYTSYGSKQPISRPWTIGISLAGPLTHIACGCLVLVAMGVNPFDHATIIETAPRQAVWWAGPIIGLFNLMPILPLDGGHVVETMLDRFIGEQGAAGDGVRQLGDHAGGAGVDAVLRADARADHLHRLPAGRAARRPVRGPQPPRPVTVRRGGRRGAPRRPRQGRARPRTSDATAHRPSPRAQGAHRRAGRRAASGDRGDCRGHCRSASRGTSTC